MARSRERYVPSLKTETLINNIKFKLWLLATLTKQVNEGNGNYVPSF